MAVIAATYAFWVATGESDEPGVATVPLPLRNLAAVLTGVTGAVLIVGTMVTGSGPHAGSAKVARNGIDAQSISQVHADLVFLLIGLAVATWFAFRAVQAGPATRRTAWFIAIIFAQG
jgi:cytochrome c oxidase assembly protein subunit 15